MNTNHSANSVTVNEDVATIEEGVQAYEDAARSHVNDWKLDAASNALTFELLPLAPEESITLEDVIVGCAESEAWFATNSTEALA